MCALKSLIKSYGLVLLFFIILAVVVFRCAWGPDQVFSGSDCNIGIVAYVHRQLPELFCGACRSGPVLGNVGVSPISFFDIGRWVLPPDLFSDIWYGVCLVFSSLFLTAYLRLWKMHWISCVFGALAAFWVGSITLASAGHVNKLGVMMFFTLALWLIENSVRASSHGSRAGFAAGAGIAVGFMLLEQQDVALLAGLFLGVYVFFRMVQNGAKKFLFWAEVLGPVAVIGLLMAVSTALTAYRENVTETGIQQDPQAQWNYVTQWSMVPAELPDLIAPGYTGWNTGNPDGPYWGEIGQSPEWKSTRQGFQNFRLDSLYLGVLPVWLAVFGVGVAFRRRKDDGELSSMIFCWAGLAMVALLLSFGKFSPLYKLFFHLPLVGNIRAPIKLLHNFQVFNAILAAYGLDQLMKTEWKWKSILISLAALAGLFVLFAISGDSSRFADWGQYAEVITRTLRFAWLHAAVMILVLAVVVYLRWKKPVKGGAVLCAFLLMGALVADSLLLTRHYFKSEDISQLKRGNAVLNYLKENQGNERIFFLDQSGVYNRWLAVEGSYYGLNFFNIWQMPRMPEEYKNFLSAAGTNQVRLWQLASVKYITAPAGVLTQLPSQLKSQLTPVMFYRFVRQGDGAGVQTLSRPEVAQDQVLLEFNAFLPRFALFHQWQSMPADEQCPVLFSRGFDPLQTVLVDGAVGLDLSSGSAGFSTVEVSLTVNKAVIETSSDQPGVLIFTQRYQPEWKVTVDGVSAKLLRCNYICMGVEVPAGKHVVQYYCY
jgi:hypothetical protein